MPTTLSWKQLWHMKGLLNKPVGSYTGSHTVGLLLVPSDSHFPIQKLPNSKPKRPRQTYIWEPIGSSYLHPKHPKSSLAFASKQSKLGGNNEISPKRGLSAAISAQSTETNVRTLRRPQAFMHPEINSDSQLQLGNPSAHCVGVLSQPGQWRYNPMRLNSSRNDVWTTESSFKQFPSNILYVCRRGDTTCLPMGGYRINAAAQNQLSSI